MDRETAKKLLPVIMAFAEGKEVEFYDDIDGKWVTATNLRFSYAPDMYRIKRVPKEIWVNEYPVRLAAHISEGRAKQHALNGAVRKAVHYREVLED